MTLDSIAFASILIVMGILFFAFSISFIAYKLRRRQPYTVPVQAYDYQYQGQPGRYTIHVN